MVFIQKLSFKNDSSKENKNKKNSNKKGVVDLVNFNLSPTAKTNAAQLISDPSDESSFDFPALPYVCQRRFAEICDGKTLKTLASINSFTRRLSNRLHCLDRVVIDFEDMSLDYNGTCYCIERCKGYADVTQLKSKIQINDTVDIRADRKRVDSSFFEALPFNLNFNEKLCLDVNQIQFDVLKTLINPNVKCFNFYGGIDFGDCPLREFIKFLEMLSTFDEFNFQFYRADSRFTFNINKLESRLSSLKRREMIDTFHVYSDSIIITKCNLHQRYVNMLMFDCFF